MSVASFIVIIFIVLVIILLLVSNYSKPIIVSYDIKNISVWSNTMPNKIIEQNCIASYHKNIMGLLYEGITGDSSNGQSVFGQFAATSDEQEYPSMVKSYVNYVIKTDEGEIFLSNLRDIPKEPNGTNDSSSYSLLLPDGFHTKGTVIGGSGIYSNIKGTYDFTVEKDIRIISIH